MRLSRDPTARRRLVVLGAVAAIALVVGGAIGAGAGGGSNGVNPAAPSEHGAPAAATPQAARAAVSRLNLRAQVGQLLISSFDGAARPDYIRRRLAARETAGVILFGRNGGNAATLRALAESLQAPADGGALVMVDQEGGPIRTLPYASPTASQPLQGSPAEILRTGRETARHLRAVGVNVNLAPVADLPRPPGSVMTGRAFAGDARAVAAATRAAVRGLQQGGVAATAKHFPGLGGAPTNTDDASATVPGALTDDLLPFRAAIAAGTELVMLSHALYPDEDPDAPASQSRAIVTGVLREELGFEGVTVTDSLEAQAVLDRSDVATAAERSVAAGVDLILMTGSGSWNEVFPRLLERARESPAFERRIRESAARVLALKRRLR